MIDAEHLKSIDCGTNVVLLCLDEGFERGNVDTNVFFAKLFVQNLGNGVFERPKENEKVGQTLKKKPFQRQKTHAHNLGMRISTQ